MNLKFKPKQQILREFEVGITGSESEILSMSIDMRDELFRQGKVLDAILKEVRK